MLRPIATKCYHYNEDGDDRACDASTKSTNTAPQTIPFLDLPAEIRNPIYYHSLPKERMIVYQLQLYINEIPKGVHIKARRIDQRHQHATVIALSHTNWQLRSEIRSNFYGRRKEGAGYRFQTHPKHRWHLPNIPGHLDQSSPKYYAAASLQDAGIPFAVTPTRTGWSAVLMGRGFQLLVPDWKQGAVTWRKLKVVGKEDLNMKNERIAFIWRESVKGIGLDHKESVQIPSSPKP